jgi:hypothetical protein
MVYKLYSLYYLRIYSGNGIYVLIRHPLGNEKWCWITEVSLCCKTYGQCQRILPGLGECWFIEGDKYLEELSTRLRTLVLCKFSS